MYDVIIGRSEDDRKRFGTDGTILIAKQYVKMGQITSLSNKVYMDVTRSHVVFVCGKRGGGKSYTLGLLAEGMANLPPDISQNISVILLDTMGIYWTMKYPNHKDEELLGIWGFRGVGLDVKIFTPTGYYHKYREEGIPTDFPFSMRPDEISATDWCKTFEAEVTSPLGVLIEGVITKLQERGEPYDIDGILALVTKDTRVEPHVRYAVENMFANAKSWGLFSGEGTSISDLVIPGQTTILDLSCYGTMPNGWAIKALVTGLVSNRLFIDRMTVRKNEEFRQIQKAEHYFDDESEEGEKMPLVWLIVDEAHEFLPESGKTAASDALITILREGRQPGISLVLASQQPGKIHTDVLTQLDILISHRITAKIDTDALGRLMQSYMRDGLDKQLDILPRASGAALIMDDQNERLYPVRMRPRFTWHGGSSPNVLEQRKKLLTL